MRQVHQGLRIQTDEIYNMDCIAGMRMMRKDRVDLIITDPPFAISFGAKKPNYNRTGSRVLEGYNEIKASDYEGFTREWLAGAYGVLKDSGSMYVFSGWNRLGSIISGLDAAGFTTINHIIWKYQFGVVTKTKFVTSHYHCLYVCKDPKKRRFYPFSRFGKDEKDVSGASLHYADKEDVWEIKREYWRGKTKTPTKLPRKIIEKMLMYSSTKSDVVMDPFLGSGQVAVVSMLMGRRYLGFEIVPEYHAFAKRRLGSGRYDP